MARKPAFITLYEPSRSSSTPDLDIVFVHGLGGDGTQTWAWQQQGEAAVCWPRDLLPADRPLSRIFSYDYNADVWNNNSIAGIRDHAHKILERLVTRRSNMDPKPPVVFVGHCLGGLIVKQALVFAKREAGNYLDIATSTCGILFFGTPHFGCDKNQVRAIAERFAPLGRTGANGAFSGLTNAIVAHSDDLKEISEDFCRVAPRYAITSWYETECWPGTGRPIVDKFSARMEIPPDLEKQRSVAADHLAICKFKDAEDETFQEVCKDIKDAIKTGYRIPEKAEAQHNKDAFSQPTLVRPMPQIAQPTHNPPIGANPREVLVRAAIQVEYEAPASTPQDPAPVLQPRAGQDTDTMTALRQGTPALMVGEFDDAQDQLPWKEQTDVLVEEVFADARNLRGRNDAAKKAGASRWSLLRKGWKGRGGKWRSREE